MTTHAIITEAIDVGLGGDMTRAAALADNVLTALAANGLTIVAVGTR
jgi:hypothetical protein